LTGLPHPEPHACCTEAPGKARWARREFACHPEHGLASTIMSCFQSELL